jgi:ADP-ribosyl-[dinitrogen reductase] hydrolase
MTTIATLVGCAIGDALGVPFEMKSWQFPALKKWNGSFRDGGTLARGHKAHQYSDDGKMTKALAESIVSCNGFDPENVAQKYMDWVASGDMRGIGSTTAMALANLKLGASYKESGLKIFNGKPTCGNGTAMRCSPIGLAYRNDPNSLIKYAVVDAEITHNSLEAKMGSIAVSLGVALLSSGKIDKKKIIDCILDILPDCVVKEKFLKTKELLS